MGFPVLDPAKIGACLLMFLCVSGCGPRGYQVKEPPSGETLVPLWSMPFGCEGGLHLNATDVSVIDREYLVDNHQWVLDLSSGRVIRHSEKPVTPEHLPTDSKTEISNGGLTPLNLSVAKSLTPPGFDPLVHTEKFVFAKKSWIEFVFPRFVHRSQLIVVDNSSRSVVWHFEAPDIAVQAAPNRVVVCGKGRTAGFLPSQSRPREIIDFYDAIHTGDTARVAQFFSAWKHSPLYDLDGFDPLTLAAKEGKVDVVKQLLALNVSPNSESADGYSPLLAALYLDNLDIAVILLKAGADPNNFAHYWEFPLTRAVESRIPGAAELLLKYGAKINAIDEVNGQTALHAAVMYRNYEAIQFLLASGANPKIRDGNGKIPIEEADPDECISHLFSGGKVSEKPTACAPIQTSTAAVHF